MADQKTIEDLETILTWEGEVDNARIRDILNVKPVWASRLLGELVQHMGTRAKRASAHAPLTFVDQKFNGSPDDYLQIVSGSEFIEDARLDISSLQPDLFSKVIQATRRSRGLRISYRSMTNPLGSQRVVFPHAIVRVSRRWHMRAWCESRKEFRDFTLGRISEIEHFDAPSPKERDGDRDWVEKVNITVIAHPALTYEQQEMIRAEYFPKAAARRLTLRRCLADYVLRDLHIATDMEKHLPPEYQLAVAKSESSNKASAISWHFP